MTNVTGDKPQDEPDEVMKKYQAYFLITTIVKKKRMRIKISNSKILE